MTYFHADNHVRKLLQYMGYRIHIHLVQIFLGSLATQTKCGDTYECKDPCLRFVDHLFLEDWKIAPSCSARIDHCCNTGTTGKIIGGNTVDTIRESGVASHKDMRVGVDEASCDVQTFSVNNFFGIGLRNNPFDGEDLSILDRHVHRAIDLVFWINNMSIFDEQIDILGTGERDRETQRYAYRK